MWSAVNDARFPSGGIEISSSGMDRVDEGGTETEDTINDYDGFFSLKSSEFS